MWGSFVDLLVADGLIVSHLPYGPTAYFAITKAVLRHDINKGKSKEELDDDTYGLSTVSQVYPHLLFENFSSKLGDRVRTLRKKKGSMHFSFLTFFIIIVTGDVYLEAPLPRPQGGFEASHYLRKSSRLHLFQVK